jgi:hypothetical protein
LVEGWAASIETKWSIAAEEWTPPITNPFNYLQACPKIEGRTIDDKRWAEIMHHNSIFG